MTEKEKFNLKDYVPVNHRILEFYDKFPKGSIQTQILDINEKRVLMRAEIFRAPDDPKPCTGHAEETRTGYINIKAAVENCETSAVGRGLALLGISVKHSVASRDEIELTFQSNQDYNEKDEFDKLKKEKDVAASQNLKRQEDGTYKPADDLPEAQVPPTLKKKAQKVREEMPSTFPKYSKVKEEDGDLWRTGAHYKVTAPSDPEGYYLITLPKKKGEKASCTCKAFKECKHIQYAKILKLAELTKTKVELAILETKEERLAMIEELKKKLPSTKHQK